MSNETLKFIAFYKFSVTGLMTLYVSEKTDIMAFYPKWFETRLKEGFFDERGTTPNTITRHSIAKQDKIVLLTKKPKAVATFHGLPLLLEYDMKCVTMVAMYDKFYDENIDRLSKMFLGVKETREKVGFRNNFCYGPIFYSPVHDKTFHLNQFAILCRKLKGNVSQAYISFYSGKDICNKDVVIKNIPPEDKADIFMQCREIAQNFDLSVEILQETNGKNIVDMGSGNSCLNGCKYCKWNQNANTAKSKYLLHNPQSSLLFGSLPFNAKIIEKKEKIVNKKSLFDSMIEKM